MNGIKKFPVFALCLLLTACGPVEEADLPQLSVDELTAAPAAAHQYCRNITQRLLLAARRPAEEAALPQLSMDELTAAHMAAHRYYRDAGLPGTVLVEIAPRAGEISFEVSRAEEGVITELDLVVSLERQDGVWTVIGEEE